MKTLIGGYGAYSHFQKYFSYIVESVLLVVETGLPGENILPATSHFDRAEMWSSVANTINVSWSANMYLKKK